MVATAMVTWQSHCLSTKRLDTECSLAERVLACGLSAALQKGC